jgi:hypothetical protein
LLRRLDPGAIDQRGEIGPVFTEGEMARHKSCEIGFDRGLKNPNSLARQKGVALCYRLAQRFDNRVGCLRTMKFIRARAKQLRSQKCARYFVVVGFRPGAGAHADPNCNRHAGGRCGTRFICSHATKRSVCSALAEADRV